MMSRKGEHWILSNNIFQFGKKFGACTKNIMVSSNRTRNAGSSLTGSVRNLINDMQISQNKSSYDRCFWRWLQSWKGRVSMDDRVRAEPHRLDNGFMKWCKQTVRENEPPQRTINNRKKGGENDAEK